MNALQAKCRWLFLVVAGSLALAGCSGKKDDKDSNGGEPDQPRPTGEVSGTVTLPDGKPLPAGWIAFHGKDASESALAPIDGGKFLAKGVPTGDKIRVTVDVDSVVAEANDLSARLRENVFRATLMKQAGKTDADLDRRIEEMKGREKKMSAMLKALQGVKVDRNYALPETTSLSSQITTGTQEANFNLK